MRKRELITVLANLQAQGDHEERRRLERYHSSRTLPDIQATLARMRSIESVTELECRTHCQTAGLPGL